MLNKQYINQNPYSLDKTRKEVPNKFRVETTNLNLLGKRKLYYRKYFNINYMSYTFSDLFLCTLQLQKET